MRTLPEKPKSRGRKILVWVLVILAVVLVAGYLGIGAVAADQVTLPKRQFYPEAAAGLGVPYQDVRFPARTDKVEIAGWYAPRAGATRAIIIVHGKDQSRATEFFDISPTGRFTEMAGKVHAAGFAVLMIDLRGHGQSGPGRFSFGQFERRDVMGAADWLKTQGFKAGSIGVYSLSLGAASSVGAAAEDTDIGALVIDSAFADFTSVLQANWNVQTGMPDFMIQPVLLMTRVMYGIDLPAVRPVDEMPRIAPRPVLIIHTPKDQAIPMSHAERNKAALSTAELWIANGPEHARNYNADPAEFVRRVTGFFDRSLPK